jgi:hypothetical protein
VNEERTTSKRCEPQLRVPAGARLALSFCLKGISQLFW